MKDTHRRHMYRQIQTWTRDGTNAGKYANIAQAQAQAHRPRKHTNAEQPVLRW